jgi:hypothetical protein
MAVNDYINQKDPPLYQRGIFYLSSFRLCVLFMFIVLATHAQPRARITDWKKNFGLVKKGVVVQNKYEIINEGNAPLLITGAEVACSCTTVRYQKEPIAPGAHAEVEVDFNTASVYGRQDRIVLLQCNDARSPLKLRFKGIVKK